jgi:hypothetical protein
LPSENKQADRPLSDATSTASPTNPSVPPVQSTKKLIAGIVAAIVVFTGLAFLALSPLSPFVSPKPPSGPKMIIGQQSYIYACGVLNPDLTATTLGLNTDKNKQAADETYAQAPDNSKVATLDLLKLTGNKAAASDCRLKFNKKTDASTGKTITFDTVVLTLYQFGNSENAKGYFVSLKDQIGPTGKPLASHKDSIYGKPSESASGPAFVSPSILHKNMVISLATPSAGKDTDGHETAQKLDKVASDVIRRIEQGEGVRPRSFNGITSMAGNTFVDNCKSINFVKIAQAIGSQAEFDSSFITSSQSFSPSEKTEKVPAYLLAR